MVERYIAKLRLTAEEQLLYSPSTGIDIVWLERESPDVVVGEFVGSDLYPEVEWRRTAADIRHEVLNSLRGRVLEDNMGTHPKSPPRIHKIETFIDHPNVTSQGSAASREIRKAAEGATEVHDVEMTKEQFDQLERPRSGKELQPREIRRKRKIIRNVRPDGRVEMLDTGEVEEKYVMAFGIIDIG